MIKSISAVAVLAVLWALPAAASTVTVENDKVTVNQPGQSTTVVQSGAPPVVPVTQAPAVAYQTVQDPRRVEGEIVNVNTPDSQILVRDIDGREHRITLKQGMINGYKVGDYVDIYLMADMQEAKTIHTQRTADIDGEVVAIDYPRNVIVVRENGGSNRSVMVQPAIIGQHKVGDHLRLYVAESADTPSAVRLIRVR